MLPPSEWLNLRYHKVISELAAISCVARGDGDGDEDDVDQLLNQLDAAYLRVKGNRAGGTPMSWADLRFVIASDLRAVAAYLEGDADDRPARA